MKRYMFFMAALVNCTPKVRQKTFGVQFVYEKDI